MPRFAKINVMQPKEPAKEVQHVGYPHTFSASRFSAVTSKVVFVVRCLAPDREGRTLQTRCQMRRRVNNSRG